MPEAHGTGTLAERYDAVRARIPAHVTLVAVSKTRSVEEIQALYDLGHRAFGENYPQELQRKYQELPKDIEWHFIGHLQTNKVKMIASFVHLVHAVDSERLLSEIGKRAAACGRTVDILLQAHIAREESKHGLQIDGLRELIRNWDAGSLPHVRLRGLMGMATLTDDEALIRSEFATLAGIFKAVKSDRKDPAFDTLSMGMSDDLGFAIAEGSTLVRVGSAIFGPRTSKAT